MQLDGETVSTKHIESIATDGKDLYIRTKTKGVLLYPDLADEYEGLLSAIDLEEYFRDNIKGQYKYKTLEESDFFFEYEDEEEYEEDDQED